MLKDLLRTWVRVSFGSLTWIIAVQMAWAMMLLFWILAYLRPYAARAAPSPGRFGWGLGFLALMILGVDILVIHFARQTAQARVVKDFISRVSHDLRSPLASVKLQLETVLERELRPDQARACLEAARQDLGRLETSIEAVLLASRLERRKPSIVTQDLDLGDFLRTYCGRMGDRVARDGGHLEIGPLPGLPIRADPALLERILDNLLANALGHCPSGVHIRVALARQGHLARLTVADDGPGIPPRERRKVFRLFYRASTARGRGTGLGLFIVASLVRAHGGRVWVECPGTGSCFQLALPLGEKPAGSP